MEIRFRVHVPQVPAGLGSNLLGLAGLVAVALAVGGLTGNWWTSVLVGGLFAFGLAWLAQQPVAPADPEAATAAPTPPDPARAAQDAAAREVAYLRGMKPAG